MPFAMRRGQRSLLAGMMLGALVAAGADAAKPPPAPTGTVYFAYMGRLNTMNPSGGAKTALPAGVAGEPSVLLHGGHRWFLQSREVPGESYPSQSCYTTRREIFAVRDDGDETRTRQLTDQPSLEASGSFRWMASDARVSWVARRWVGGVVVEGGIYTSPVLFDTSGDVVGLATQPVSPTVTTPLVVWGGNCSPCCTLYDRDLGPDAAGHDWAPDGNHVAYVQLNKEMWIATVAPAGAVRLVTTHPGGEPRWSPDGSKILFNRSVYGGGVVTVRPNGLDERLVIVGRGGQSTQHVTTPSWSPDSANILYGIWTTPLGNDRNDVHRARADGSGKSNLTSDLDTRNNLGHPASPNAWR